MIHVTSLRVKLPEQVTTPTILICNINNETIKICSSCKQFSTVQCIQVREHRYIYDEQAQLGFLYDNTLTLHTNDLKFKRNAHSDVMSSFFIRYLSCLASSVQKLFTIHYFLQQLATVSHALSHCSDCALSAFHG